MPARHLSAPGRTALWAAAAFLLAVPARAVVQFSTTTYEVTNSNNFLIPAASSTNIASPQIAIGLRDRQHGLRLGQAPLANSSSTVALWRFDEEPGDRVASDLTNHGFDLSLKCFNPTVTCSSPTFNTASIVSGNFGNAIVLDGQTDNVSTMNASVATSGTPLDLAGPLTWEAWVEPLVNASQAVQQILETRPNQYGLYMDASGAFVCRTNDGGTSDLASVTHAAAGNWYFVACVFDAVSNGESIYVNGVLERQRTPSGALTQNGPVLTFGVNQADSGSSHQFNGNIAEARILGRAETADEIASDYYSGTARFTIGGPAGPYGPFVTDLSKLSFTADPNFTVDPTLSATTTVNSAGFVFSNCSPTNYVQFIAQDVLGGLVYSPPLPIYVTATPPPARGPPTVAPGNLGINSITWSWPNNACDGTYVVFTTTVQPPAQLGVVPTPTFTSVGLSTNTAYSLMVLAQNATGQAPLTTASTYFTLAAAPSGTRLVRVATSTIALAWQANGNPAYTPYAVSYGPVGGSTSTLFSQAPAALISNLSILTTWFVYVQGANGNAVAPSTLTAADVELSTATGDALQEAGAQPGDALTIQGTLRNRSVSLAISPNTFASPYIISLVDASTFPCGVIAPGGISSAGISITIQPPQQPSVPLTLSLTYSNAEVTGATPSRLELVRYDEGTGLCLPLETQVDAPGRKLTSRINHLSVYQIVQSTAPPATLDKPRVYPNPLYVSRGQGYFTLRDMPPGTSVKIFTLRGELLFDGTADGSGYAVWEAVNPSGNKVASGVYLALLDFGGARKILKLAVER